MRIGSLLLWLGIIGVIREWRYAKRLGAPVTRTEKWYLAGALVLAFALGVIGDATGLTDGLRPLLQTGTTAPFLTSIALIAWAARQMMRRVRSRPSQQAVTTSTAGE